MYRILIRGGVKIGKGIKPLVIPQNQMDSFIKWQNVDDENKLFIADDHMDFERNDVVITTKSSSAHHER